MDCEVTFGIFTGERKSKYRHICVGSSGKRQESGDAVGKSDGSL